MNREIKFRAVVIDHKRSKRLEYNVWPCGQKASGFKTMFVESDRSWMEYESIQQFTGLKDKNGKEIYEGDILRWLSCNPFSKGEIRVVQVYYIEAHFWCNGSIGCYLGELLVNEKCEIIGNIFENPELLPSTSGK